MAVGPSSLEMLGMNPAFWSGKKVLVTGHTGFKGSWLCLWLQMLEADVYGIALDPPGEPSLFEVARVAEQMRNHRQDIRNAELLKQRINEIQPDIVFHLAAQPLVRYSYQFPMETWETNVMGSLFLLEAVRQCHSVRAVVMVTTDKCYQNDSSRKKAFQETDSLGGFDPYSSSKAAMEIMIDSWRNSFFSEDSAVAVASARAGNVIGGGDWADDRLVPDIIRAFQNQETLQIRYPRAVRPWQYVLEPLAGYLLLAEKLFSQGRDFAQAWNFGPATDDARPVEWIVRQMATFWKTTTNWVVDTDQHPHEAGFLELDCRKARQQLGWQPQWSLQQGLEQVVRWHQAQQEGLDMRTVCLQQIENYQQDVVT